MYLYDDDEPIDDFLYDEEELDEDEDFEEYPLEYEDELQEEFENPSEEEVITDELDEQFLHEEGFFIENEKQTSLEEESLDIIDYEDE